MPEDVSLFVLIGLCLAGCIVAYLLSRRRTRELRRFARRIGFDFMRTHSIEKDPTLSPMRALPGVVRRCRNILGGVYRGVEVAAMDVARSGVSGAQARKGKSTSGNVTVCLHPLGGNFPDLSIRSYKLVESDFLGLFRSDDRHDIEFESDEFNRAFRVACEDRRFAFDFCYPQMMAHLLSHRRWVIFVSNSVLLVHDATLWGEEDYTQALDFVSDTAKLIPEHLRRRYGGENSHNGEDAD